MAAIDEKTKIQSLEAEITTLKKVMKDQGDKLIAAQKDSALLAAANSEVARLEQLVNDANGQITELKAMTDSIDNSFVAELTNDYELTPIAEKSPCSRYDGLEKDGMFVFHEEMTFVHDNGYSASAVRDRAKGSIDRAMTDQRLGVECANLPPFSTDLALEVIVRILPIE